MITAEGVAELFCMCLAPRGAEDIIIVDGVFNKSNFSKFRLNENKARIINFLKELPDSFMMTGGRGDSFSASYKDSKGVQWSNRQEADYLLMLGTGIDCVRAILPRPLWGSLPGGVPYYAIKLDGFDPLPQLVPKDAR